MAPKLYGLLDADCFYVSCERARKPSLNGKSVGVLGNQGVCVIARSYEMKARGVTVGMPLWEAKKICPDGIYIERDFRWYEQISRRIIEQINAVSPLVEYYSIDEMFFSADQLKPPVLDSIRQLQERVKREVGIPVSIGVSTTKVLAKLLCDLSKPYGCAVLLERAEILPRIGEYPVDEIWGIARRSADKLRRYGIVTCGDFLRADSRLIRRLLTVKGESLWYELRGESVLPILTRRPAHKSIGRGGSFGQTIPASQPDGLLAWAARNVERLIEELDYHQIYANCVAIVLRKNDNYWFGRASLPGPTASFALLLEGCKSLLARSPPTPSYGMEVWGEHLCRRQHVQQTLFQDHSRELEAKHARVAAAKHLINDKLGRFVLRSADTLSVRKEIYENATNDYDIGDIRGKMCF